MQPGAEAPAAFPLAAGSSSTSLAAALIVQAVMTVQLQGGPASGPGFIDPSAVDHMVVEVGFSNFNVAVSGPIKVTVL